MTRKPALILLAFVLLAGCGHENPTRPGATSIRALLDGVTVGSSAGLVVDGEVPVGDGPAPAVAASDTFVAGGSTLVMVAVPDSATALWVGATGRAGSYRVSLTPATAQEMVARTRKLALAMPDGDRLLSSLTSGNSNLALVVRPQRGQRQLPLVFGVEYPHSSARPATHTLTASTRATASDQLQVSLSWSDKVDLDLHVQVPAGSDSTDIYYGNRIAAGGMLDLDSNMACAIDDVDNENITWGTNTPPAGHYRIRVDLWSACTLPQVIHYTVTLRQCGVSQTFQDSTSRPFQDGGTRFSGRVVHEFDFTPCPAPAAMAAARR